MPGGWLWALHVSISRTDPFSALKALNARALDFADSLMPKGSSFDDLSDFNDALNELTGIIDNLDEPTASAGSQPAGRPYPNESLAYNF